MKPKKGKIKESANKQGQQNKKERTTKERKKNMTQVRTNSEANNKESKWGGQGASRGLESWSVE